jgi:hypothetical protein
MKSSLLILFLSFFGIQFAYAETYRVDDTDLNIPAPIGFVRVTPQMNAVYRLSQLTTSSSNEQLAFYIQEKDGPAAMSGALPKLNRYFSLQLNKRLKGAIVTGKDFGNFKNVIKRQNADLIKSLESQFPSLFDIKSRQISKAFNIQIALRLTTMIPLEMHVDENNAFAYSFFGKLGISTEENQKDLILSGTCSFINVSDKVVFLYCYGEQDDLDWTRTASRDWAERILNNTSTEAQKTTARTNQALDWGKVGERTLIGVTAVAVVFLGSYLVSKSRGNKG